ncbi:hypothetical protein [Streptococcus suis]|uniref:hypothetical protein n=1 Tax=Streptococcus suis TaxID=1307 RepID=UPI000C1983E0|nr:hypothetical protein [Streptococcus suis]
MSIINQLKSQSKTVLAAVAITAATVGFAGGMSISKLSNQSQASLAQNQTVTNSQANTTNEISGILPGQENNTQEMTPPYNAGERPQGMPPGQNGNTQGLPPGQGTTPPDATSGATQSNTSSDEVNALKEKNQEIKAQISGSSSTSNQ